MYSLVMAENVMSGGFPDMGRTARLNFNSTSSRKT
jgi:hypothetical protein